MQSTVQRGAARGADCQTAVIQIWAAGDDRFGQLGRGEAASAYSATASYGSGDGFDWKPQLVANDVGNPAGTLGNEDVFAVAAGFSHTLLLTKSDTKNGTEVEHVWAAGENTYGQLGRDPGAQRVLCTFPDSPDYYCDFAPIPNPTPAQLDPALVGLGAVRAVAAGRHTSAVVMMDGRAYFFGYNRYGQLGRIDGIETDGSNWMPATVAGKDVRAVALGGYHSLLQVIVLMA